MSELEKVGLAQAFNRGKRPVSYIVRYLESEIVKLDNELNDINSLYSKPGCNEYVAGLLAKRSFAMNMHQLLTTTVDVDQTEI